MISCQDLKVFNSFFQTKILTICPPVEEVDLSLEMKKRNKYNPITIKILFLNSNNNNVVVMV